MLLSSWHPLAPPHQALLGGLPRVEYLLHHGDNPVLEEQLYTNAHCCATIIPTPIARYNTSTNTFCFVSFQRSAIVSLKLKSSRKHQVNCETPRRLVPLRLLNSIKCFSTSHGSLVQFPIQQHVYDDQKSRRCVWTRNQWFFLSLGGSCVYCKFDTVCTVNSIL